MMTAEPAVAVLGVLAFTAEYAAGPVRAPFAGTPRRWAVLAAKAATAGAVVFAAAGRLVSFLAGAIRSGPHHRLSPSRPRGRPPETL